MNPQFVQRWLFRKDRYRPAGEPIDAHEYEVAPIDDDATAKGFVLEHHYSGTYPAARFRSGLYNRYGTLVGVAVFSHPCRDSVLTSVFPGRATDAVELGRFVLTNDVPANGETWFLGQAFAHLRREGLRGVVSFSDPFPRTDEHGHRVFPGHIGTIYQAHNAVYTGRATARTLRLLPKGQVLSDRAIQKIRRAERGWSYAVEQLVRAGAKLDADLTIERERQAWLARTLKALTRTVRHPGNHRYAWALNRRVSVALPTLPYPKAVL